MENKKFHNILFTDALVVEAICKDEERPVVLHVAIQTAVAQEVAGTNALVDRKRKPSLVELESSMPVKCR